VKDGNESRPTGNKMNVSSRQFMTQLDSSTFEW